MSTSSKSIPRAIGVAIVIAAISVAGWFFFIKGPPESANKFYDVASRIAKDIDKVLHMRPLVTSGGVTIIEASGSIAELSTIEKTFEQHLHMEKQVAGQYQTNRVEGGLHCQGGI